MNSTFPIQARPGTNDPRAVPWRDAAVAHAAYRRLFATAGKQTLDELAARGGFGWVEFLALSQVAVYWRAHPDAATSELDKEFQHALTAHHAMTTP